MCPGCRRGDFLPLGYAQLRWPPPGPSLVSEGRLLWWNEAWRFVLGWLVGLLRSGHPEKDRISLPDPRWCALGN